MLLILNPDYRDHTNAFIKGIIKKRSTHALKFIKFNEGIKKDILLPQSRLADLSRIRLCKSHIL